MNMRVAGGVGAGLGRAGRRRWVKRDLGTGSDAHSDTAELNSRGELLGVEIINASTFVRDSLLESIHGRMLDFTKRKSA